MSVFKLRSVTLPMERIEWASEQGIMRVFGLLHESVRITSADPRRNHFLEQIGRILKNCKVRRTHNRMANLQILQRHETIRQPKKSHGDVIQHGKYPGSTS